LGEVNIAGDFLAAARLGSWTGGNPEMQNDKLLGRV
jgi:hypothetical protein